MSVFITARSILAGSRVIAGLGYVKSRTEHLIVRRQPRGMRELPMESSRGWVRREGVILQDEEVAGRWGGFFFHVLRREDLYLPSPPVSLNHQALRYGFLCLTRAK